MLRVEEGQRVNLLCKLLLITDRCRCTGVADRTEQCLRPPERTAAAKQCLQFSLRHIHAEINVLCRDRVCQPAAPGQRQRVIRGSSGESMSRLLQCHSRDVNAVHRRVIRKMADKINGGAKISRGRRACNTSDCDPETFFLLHTASASLRIILSAAHPTPGSGSCAWHHLTITMQVTPDKNL